jgi:hypothetical protein
MLEAGQPAAGQHAIAKTKKQTNIKGDASILEMQEYLQLKAEWTEAACMHACKSTFHLAQTSPDYQLAPSESGAPAREDAQLNSKRRNRCYEDMNLARSFPTPPIFAKHLQIGM